MKTENSKLTLITFLTTSSNVAILWAVIAARIEFGYSALDAIPLIIIGTFAPVISSPLIINIFQRLETKKIILLTSLSFFMLCILLLGGITFFTPQVFYYFSLLGILGQAILYNISGAAIDIHSSLYIKGHKETHETSTKKIQRGMDLASFLASVAVLVMLALFHYKGLFIFSLILSLLPFLIGISLKKFSKEFSAPPSLTLKTVKILFKANKSLLYLFLSRAVFFFFGVALFNTSELKVFEEINGLNNLFGGKFYLTMLFFDVIQTFGLTVYYLIPKQLQRRISMNQLCLIGLLGMSLTTICYIPLSSNPFAFGLLVFLIGISMGANRLGGRALRRTLAENNLPLYISVEVLASNIVCFSFSTFVYITLKSGISLNFLFGMAAVFYSICAILHHKINPEFKASVASDLKIS